MVLLSGVDSIIESIYLGRGLTENSFEATVIVNPDQFYYENKIIWVNSPNYDLGKLSELSKSNVIKSRIKLEGADFKYTYTPYRSDRIKRLNIKVNVESDDVVSDNDTSRIIIYHDTEGNLATTLPKCISLDTGEYKGTSYYWLYLRLIRTCEDGN